MDGDREELHVRDPQFVSDSANMSSSTSSEEDSQDQASVKRIQAALLESVGSLDSDKHATRETDILDSSNRNSTMSTASSASTDTEQQ